MWSAGGVRAGVARPQQSGQGLAGVVQEAQQRVVAEAAFVGGARPVPSRSGRSPGWRRCPGPGRAGRGRRRWAAGMPVRVSAACSQATSRAAARADRRPASAAGSMPASTRQAVGVEATGPNTSAWSRSTARSPMASPPSASITARSTAILPGSCPVPRGRSRRSASVKALVRPVASARSASSRDPAWLTTPRPSAETTSLGRDPVVCTQKVPSCWDDRDLRQASSSQLRRHFRVPAQDPDTAAR